MAMKFRSHQDPLYYDPKTNDKIFVPMISEVTISSCFILSKHSIKLTNHTMYTVGILKRQAKGVAEELP